MDDPIDVVSGNDGDGDGDKFSQVGLPSKVHLEQLQSRVSQEVFCDQRNGYGSATEHKDTKWKY